MVILTIGIGIIIATAGAATTDAYTAAGSNPRPRMGSSPAAPIASARRFLFRPVLARQPFRHPLERVGPCRRIGAAMGSAGRIGSVDEPGSQPDRGIGAIEFMMRLRIND